MTLLNLFFKKCPKCILGKLTESHSYHFDKEDALLKSKVYSCNRCPFYKIDYKKTDITKKDAKEAKNILKKHDLLIINPYTQKFKKNKIEKCPECGLKAVKWIKHSEEFLCTAHGLAMPEYTNFRLTDYEKIKEILTNKDSIKQLKKSAIKE